MEGLVIQSNDSVVTNLVSEAGDKEESRGEEEDHEGSAGLALPQSSIDHHLVEPPQLGCQCLVLALKGFDLLLQISELQLQLSAQPTHSLGLGLTFNSWFSSEQAFTLSSMLSRYSLFLFRES